MHSGEHEGEYFLKLALKIKYQEHFWAKDFFGKS